MLYNPIEIVTSGSAIKTTAWLTTPTHSAPSPPVKPQKNPRPTPNTIGGTANGSEPSAASVRDSLSLAEAVDQAQESGRKYISIAGRVLAGDGA